MKFSEAIEFCKRGARIERADPKPYKGYVAYVGLSDTLSNRDKYFSEEHILAEDWIVTRTPIKYSKIIGGKNKLHTFKEVLEALKEGKVVRRKKYGDKCHFLFKEGYVIEDENLCFTASFEEEDTLANDWIIED